MQLSKVDWIILFLISILVSLILVGFIIDHSFSRPIQEPNEVDPVDCVVLIETGMFFGSGVVISEDGIILTAGHMLEFGLPDKVTFKDGTEWTEFEYIFQDDNLDIGFIKLVGVENTPYLSLGDSSELKIGEEIWAIGMPFGEEWWYCYGYISKESEKGRLFMSMPLNPGNSGCPILNSNNEIVGICTDGILPGNNIACGYTSNICFILLKKYRVIYGLGKYKCLM